MSIVENRKFVASLIKKILTGEISVLNAVKIFPKNCNDTSIQTALYAILHFEADEDLRKDKLYRETQDDYLINLMEILDKGEELPLNITKEYEKYYKTPLFSNKKGLDNIISQFKRIINF